MSDVHETPDAMQREGAGPQPEGPSAAEQSLYGASGGVESADSAAPSSPVDVSPAAGEAGLPHPRLVRQVVCGYRLGSLPGDWLRTWRCLDRLLASTGFQVKASLSPLEHLPAETDILVVPPELRDVARVAAVPNTPILVTPAAAAAGAFGDLVSRLEAGTEFTAERSDPSHPDGARPE